MGGARSRSWYGLWSSRGSKRHVVERHLQGFPSKQGLGKMSPPCWQDQTVATRRLLAMLVMIVMQDVPSHLTESRALTGRVPRYVHRIAPRPVKSTRRLAATLSMMTRRKGSSDILAAKGTSRSAGPYPACFLPSLVSFHVLTILSARITIVSADGTQG